MNAALIGATKGMGRALARELAERGAGLFLLGRDETQLAKSAADLEIRGARDTVGWAPCDMLDPTSFASGLDAAGEALEDLDTVVITAGVFASQEELENDSELRDRMLQVNFVNTIHFCEEARTRLLARGGGNLVVFSSVAGDRARKPVALYGAAKGGLSHYMTGLDHRYRADGLTSVLVKPGFVRTSMTTDLDAPPFAGEPEQVARDVLRAIDRRAPVVYTPRIWRWVMAVIQALPRSIMRRIQF